MRRDVVMKLLGGRLAVTQSPSRSPPPPSGRAQAEALSKIPASVARHERHVRRERGVGAPEPQRVRWKASNAAFLPGTTACLLNSYMRCGARDGSPKGMALELHPLAVRKSAGSLRRARKSACPPESTAASNGVRPESESSTSDANASGALVLPGTLDGGFGPQRWVAWHTCQEGCRETIPLWQRGRWSGVNNNEPRRREWAAGRRHRSEQPSPSTRRQSGKGSIYRNRWTNAAIPNQRSAWSKLRSDTRIRKRWCTYAIHSIAGSTVCPWGLIHILTHDKLEGCKFRIKFERNAQQPADPTQTATNPAVHSFPVEMHFLVLLRLCRWPPLVTHNYYYELTS